MRNSSGSPSAATAMSGGGQPKQCECDQRQQHDGESHQEHFRERGGRCGNSELANAGRAGARPGAALKSRQRNQSGPSPRRGVRWHAAEPAVLACGNVGFAHPAFRGGTRRRRVRVRCSSGRPLQDEEVANQVVDVGRARAR